MTEATADRLLGVLAEAEGIDATIAYDDSGSEIEFSREAKDAASAILSAIEQVQSVGIEVLGVNEDLVDAEAITKRAGVTAAAVSHWASGKRGPSGFPTPVVKRPRSSLWSWAAVSQWLHQALLGKIDHAAVEAAEAGRWFDALLTLKHTQHAVPAAQRASHPCPSLA